MNGRERYVFFSFPHIAIKEDGEVGQISRPGRLAVSSACGALIKALGDISKDGLGEGNSECAGGWCAGKPCVVCGWLGALYKRPAMCAFHTRLSAATLAHLPSLPALLL